jgi:ATP-dependent DNA helicase PIF1
MKMRFFFHKGDDKDLDSLID